METQHGMQARHYMRRAIALAGRGIPWASPNPLVGAVIVKEGRIIGEGWHEKCGQLHAERNALANCTESPRGATIYVTLEPCPMCAGAIINARIAELRYGAREEKSGCCGSVLNLFEERFNHRPRIYGGLLAEESSALLREFFQKRREKDETVV